MSSTAKKIVVALIVLSIAFLSAFFTVYNYLKHPENREYFLKRLERARETNPIKESVEMLKERLKGGEHEHQPQK
ncbi:hypothetical protein [Aquifex aeolicus]|uniref:hypothetical protein n=1 Tax=Aquifex aeolicus TaxID=63363 RepID=UPI0002E5E565|nr:hypothetical protein [Aquifex aeolicus]